MSRKSWLALAAVGLLGVSAFFVGRAFAATTSGTGASVDTYNPVLSGTTVNAPPASPVRPPVRDPVRPPTRSPFVP